MQVLELARHLVAADGSRNNDIDNASDRAEAVPIFPLSAQSKYMVARSFDSRHLQPASAAQFKALFKLPLGVALVR